MTTPMRVFVLVFNARTENEGIHSVRVGEQNKILMFESEDDATRFALMLEAQDFPTPTVEAINAEEIKEFCKNSDYEWELVLENGDLVVPPDMNVEQTDWQEDAQTKDTGEETFPPNEPAATESELSDPEMEKIRRKLEGLL